MDSFGVGPKPFSSSHPTDGADQIRSLASLTKTTEDKIKAQEGLESSSMSSAEEINMEGKLGKLEKLQETNSFLGNKVDLNCYHSPFINEEVLGKGGNEVLNATIREIA